MNFIFLSEITVYLALSTPEHYLMTVSRIVHVNLERVHLGTYVSAIFCLLQEKLDILYSECFVIPVFLHTLTLYRHLQHIFILDIYYYLWPSQLRKTEKLADINLESFEIWSKKSCPRLFTFKIRYDKYRKYG